MFHKLRWQIAIPFVLLISATIICMGVYLSNFARQTYLENLEGELIAEARLIGDSINQILITDPSPGYLDSKAKNWSNIIDKRVTIIAPDGNVLGESHEDRKQMDNHIDRPEVQLAMIDGEGSSTRFSHTLEQRMMYAAVPITTKSEMNGFIRLAIPLEKVDSDVSHIRRTLIAVVIFSIVLAIILTLWMSARITGPIQELTKFARDISGEWQMESETEVEKLNEIEQLKRSINLMTQKLQTQIKASEVEKEKIAAVLREMTDGVIIIDSTGRVQLMNPAAEKVFRIEHEKSKDRSLIEVLRHHQLNELWRESYQSGESKYASIEISNPNLHLQVVATPFGETLPGSTLLLLQDITQLHQLETVRQDFISNISHELRTPLASLKALSETLQEGALEDPPAAKIFLSRMETEVDSLSLMVSELLELSRIESGKFPLTITAVHPCELIDMAVDRLRLQTERSGLELLVICSSDLPHIQADAKRLEQVLVNLLHNAIKFTVQGGISVKAERENHRVIFSVQDTGVGIPADDLMRVFERFYKSDRSRSSTGTGLGLAIARHLVESHNGYIWVESVEGEGSTFYFSIPIANPVPTIQ